MLEKDINVLKTRIQSISLSVKKMEELVSETTEDTEASEADLADLEETSDDSPDEENHGLNVLRLIQHNKLELSEQIKKQLQQTLSGNQHKLEVLSWLLKTDTNRAKVTLAEIIASEKNIEQDVNNIVNELSRVPDVSEPIWTLLDDTFLEYKEAHPECVIQTDIDCPDYDIHIDPIITENLLFIIKEIMDNSFKHSNANRITIKIFISGRLIDVYINDNGVGIDTNYKLQAPWYSGLHKIQEIIYLLGGHIKIDGDLISGTNVRFSFPVNEKGQNNEE
jgi:two-component system sensor histidine kinase DegS